MKKATFIAAACALVLGAQSLAAQEVAQEVTYTTDPSQGILMNRMQDNWFITAEGGASFYIASKSIHYSIGKRFMPAGSIYVGKWFTPVFGARAGVNVLGLKGLATGPNYYGVLPGATKVDGYYPTKYLKVGPVFDLMVNLTNWWCGYKPNRVYNATAYVGAGAYFTFTKKYKDNSNEAKISGAHNDIMTLRAGIINSFRVSQQVALSLDVRFSGLDGLQNYGGEGWSRKYGSLQAYLGITYNFKNREWAAPVVPVYPEPENCDALRARIAAADARIADLEAQLKDCLNRPVEKVETVQGPLATIYYPIGVSRLNAANQRVVKAIAHVMTQNPDKTYTLTGWADNYTGTDNINIRLRKARAEGVAKLLKKTGVPESQITVTTNNGNLSDLGEKCVALDRAVTIDENK